ncbi:MULTISPECIES: N-acetylneuraminate epimerase [Proteus]|uniref:N-acetylneuraminate epimerase n=1 Tax=Proteus vulgaris TaxID=585 RepID=A0A379F919_PROVU|nr:MULTISPECIES: N-acetylneuraminate epimerase [Proteus]RNT30418.1 YjhT family mutarotase [Proteus mirabilis]AYY82395.1 YjhT family mutarotase [Proteus vulgaris]KGA58047.1 N-acetylneuraminate epimerase [Proteus vulgaris]MBW3472492.1 N-acetylneuraminate epimerase [Proteus vulgaris]NBN75959.1 YjhT family mutarotase [Proteus sp. G2615]
MNRIKKISYSCLSVMLVSAIFTSTSFAEKLPNLPVTFKSGAGAISKNVIYVGLGTAGKSWYKLDLNGAIKQWEKIADFPGTQRDQAIALELNNNIYVFGGAGKENENSATISALTDVYRYLPQENKWEKVNTRAPYGLVGHAGVNINNEQAIILGGVNQQIFDGYFVDLDRTKANKSENKKVISDYFNKPAEGYFFNRNIMEYNAENNQWRLFGVMPFNGTAGSALASDGHKITLINGEIKPGLRTSEVQTAILKNNQLQWNFITQKLPDPAPNQQQDGLAGAFAGYSMHTLLVAGGANFPGAQANYAQQHYFAHQGLEKTWHKEIYGFVNNQWKVIGELPLPLGYGVTISHDNSLYLIGGETNKGEAVNSVITLTMKDKQLIIE